MDDYNGHFEMIDPRLVVVDHRYQRPLKPALVAAISTDPRWELFGVPVLFKRSSTFYAADGQQRITGMLKAAEPPKRIPAVWFDAAHLEDEAAVFVQINEFRKALTTMEKHRGKIVAKDPAALVVEKVVFAAGLSISDKGGGHESSRNVSAIGALYEVYNLIGEEGLLQTLVVTRDAFPDDNAAFSSPILKMIGNVILEQDGAYERAKLTAALQRTSVPRILRKAEELKFEMGGSQQTNLRRALKVLVKL